jgi:cytochrome P450
MVLVGTDELFQIYDWARELRESGPVHPAEDGTWKVVRHAEARKVMMDHRIFSSDLRPLFGKIGDDDDFPLLSQSDPPRHRELRNLMSAAFTAHKIASLEPQIEAVSAELIDSVLERGETDVVADLAMPLPLIVIAELLAIPAERREDFTRWSNAYISTLGMHGEKPPEIAKELAELDVYMMGLIAERRANPGDDMVSVLCHARLDGEALPDKIVIGFCTALLVAGYVTTTNLLSNAVLCLNRHPAALQLIRQQPEVLHTFVDEVMRFTSPVQSSVPRLTRVETTLGDHVIPEKALVFPYIGASNRDELVFEKADQFNPTRDPNPHLGFGHGVHFCLGAPLARMEARIGIGMMAQRLRGEWRVPEDVQLEVEPPPAFLFGPKALPLKWGE